MTMWKWLFRARYPVDFVACLPGPPKSTQRRSCFLTLPRLLLEGPWLIAPRRLHPQTEK